MNYFLGVAFIAFSPISHDCAVRMLHRRGVPGGIEFMAADVGLGVFVAECGANRIALHQVARVCVIEERKSNVVDRVCC